MEQQLTGLGVSTVADMRSLSKAQLVSEFGDRLGLHLFGLCRGIDSTAVKPVGPAKSITVEDSFKSCSTWVAVKAVLQVGRMHLAMNHPESPAVLSARLCTPKQLSS